jgi:hypothetical protein
MTRFWTGERKEKEGQRRTADSSAALRNDNKRTGNGKSDGSGSGNDF